MLLNNCGYKEFAEKIKTKNKKIIVYGAGMIGRIVVPYLVKEHELYDNLVCFVDMDQRKWGCKIKICSREYEITNPDFLKTIDDSYVLLITNSKFISVINFLDSISSLSEVTGYIIPIMQTFNLEHSESIIIERKSANPLIPKRIHYCWFGGKELPACLQKCIESWKEKCPDYEIIEWNENNYDVNRHVFTKEAYENGKYGFVTDVVRLDILYENGGIYLDTDVTLMKSLDDLLYQDGFIGTEKWGNINSGGGCGFVAGHPMLKKMLDYRDQFHFVLEDGSLNMETNGLYETCTFLEEGFKPNNRLQSVGNVTVYPSYVNHPYDYMSCEIHKKAATVSVHHFYGGWMEDEDRLNRENTQNQYQDIVNRIKSGGRP